MKYFKMYIVLSLIFLSISCANNIVIKESIPELDTMSFDVVEKKLIINQILPFTLENLIGEWFSNKVKVAGFEGKLTFSVTKFSQEISQIDNGKRVDLSLNFNAIIEKPSLSQKKYIEGIVTSFGSIDGNFSLAEFDTVIENTQKDLILRLSRDLKSKI